MAANKFPGAYEVFEASAGLGDPEWPDVTFKEILKIAFKEQFIDSIDLHVIKRLRGNTFPESWATYFIAKLSLIVAVYNFVRPHCTLSKKI